MNFLINQLIEKGTEIKIDLARRPVTIRDAESNKIIAEQVEFPVRDDAIASKE